MKIHTEREFFAEALLRIHQTILTRSLADFGDCDGELCPECIATQAGELALALAIEFAARMAAFQNLDDDGDVAGPSSTMDLTAAFPLDDRPPQPKAGAGNAIGIIQ